jgi:uncharacterized protein YneF (UPF0154 family)
MGIITWIIVIVVVLAIIGLGVGTFFSGVWTGAKNLATNPALKNATQAGKSITNTTGGNPASQPPSSTPAALCDQSLWNHVYHPNRLQVLNPCVSVTGTIENINAERDGDFHIRLKLDPAYSSMINKSNVVYQRGDLVVEPICQQKVSQSDAVAACSNFHQNIQIPRVGTHVRVTGSYVLDREHFDWAEIHPATSITSE